MSKKTLPNRLDSLFQDMDDLESVQSQELQPKLPGWYWECTSEGVYISCSPEIEQALGIDPGEFAGRSIFTHRVRPDSAAGLRAAFERNIYPQEVEVIFQAGEDRYLPVRFTILNQMAKNGHEARWQGFVQVLSDAALPAVPVSQPVDDPQLPPASSQPPKPQPASGTLYRPAAGKKASGVAVEGGEVRATSALWTRTAIQSLSQNQILAHPGGDQSPSAIAAPIHLTNHGSGILEIVDDDSQRDWSEDERLLVQEVASQLGLALENAQLYQAVQQELSERTRAEQEIRERNQDLATLNQAGQQLSKLTSVEEILELVSAIIGQILGDRNLSIVLYDAKTRQVLYPVHIVEGQRQTVSPAELGNDLIGYLYWTKKPVLIESKAESELVERGINLPNSLLPQSVLAIPLLNGERMLGGILLQDFEREHAYSAIHVELLSTLASQVTTAIENATLFQEIRAALSAIENRERYQANVAQVAATLSRYGSKAIQEVLQLLGEAAQCSRVSYFQSVDDEHGQGWQQNSAWVSKSEYTSPDLNLRISRGELPYIEQQVSEKGWMENNVVNLAGPDREMMEKLNIRSLLVMAVPGRLSFPNLIAFEQLDGPRDWKKEEVSILQVAADALSNTILRENLLKQVQGSLRETETLYNLSHSLALASGVEEMLSLIAGSIHDPEINRYVLVTFQRDPQGALTGMTVDQTWHNGEGTPPPPSGYAYDVDVFGRIFTRPSPEFIEDTGAAALSGELRAAWDAEQIGAVALFPLWIGRRQIGVFYAAADHRHTFPDQIRRYTPPLVDQMATAIENQRLFHETQKALSETGLLYEVSSALSKAVTPDDLVDVARQYLMPAGCDRVSLTQFNYGSDAEILEMEFVGFYDSLGERSRTGLRLPSASMPYIKHIGTEPEAFPDIRVSDIDPVTKKLMSQYGVVGACYVPLRSEGRLVGILMVTSGQQVQFKAEELRSLHVAASGIAVTLEKQRLLREAQRRALELQTAAELARDTTSTLALDQLLNRIVSLLCERFNFYHASIFLLDSTRNYAVIRESIGDAGRDMKVRGYKLAVGSKSIIGAVTQTGQPLIISDTAKSPIYFPNPLLPDTRAEMGIPLKLGERVIGALDIQSTTVNAFTKDDLSVLQILADQIAIAIENARSYELSQRAVEEMREVDRMKSQFLANMSHELRTPLNSIIGFSKVILKGIDGPINETQNTDLTAIYNSGQHLLTLINDILDLSKIEAGKMELSFGDCQISEVTTSVMSTAVGLVKGKPVKLVQNVPTDLPTVRADSTRVRQVLLNFISNAAKFTDEGSITVDAYIANSPNGNKEMVVTVTDTGPGIAPEDTHKLFQPFSQVDDSPTRKTGGTGLGLSICRSLIEMHGGRIGLLSSEIGVGSTFFFSLPLTLAEPVPDATGQLAEGNLILCIDDDQQVIGLYTRYLQPHGYRVEALTDPHQAVTRAKEVHPAAITLDIMMPEKDGWQVLRDLKNDPDTRNIPIVVCSILEEEEKGFNLGAADYLVKPFVQEDLINAINRLNPDGQVREVLVVDDSPDDLRLVQKMIENSGQYHVTLAEGGQAGWEMIQSKPPDALVLDLFMPGMNGFDILERLRGTPKYCAIPVVVLTGADLTPEQQQQMANFGQQLLAKGSLDGKGLLNSLEASLKQLHLITVKQK